LDCCSPSPRWRRSASGSPFPLPLLLVAGGIALSYLPGFDELGVEPDVFFLLFIPPLLFADGWG
jgi:NhaP-type Na+/H+ or K+/H+ antiporter